eukprot:1008704-Amphidinium_carterae.1
MRACIVRGRIGKPPWTNRRHTQSTSTCRGGPDRSKKVSHGSESWNYRRGLASSLTTCNKNEHWTQSIADRNSGDHTHIATINGS